MVLVQVRSRWNGYPGRLAMIMLDVLAGRPESEPQGGGRRLLEADSALPHRGFDISRAEAELVRLERE